MAELTREKLRDLLDYDPAVGEFYWKQKGRGRVLGRPAGRISTGEGYRVIMVEGQLHRAHRLAWLYVHGEWPAGQVDHVNRVRLDNRIENLRVVGHVENCHNTSAEGRGASGVRGVFWSEHHRKWRAEIKYYGRRKYLGSFEDKEDAAKAYAAARRELHPSAPH